MPGRLPPDARARLTISIDASVPVTLPLASREHICQIAQEAVINCLRHARATSISVRLMVRPGRIELEVADDGIGFGPAGPSEGLGRESIRTRAVALRGHLTIRGDAGSGTALHCICSQPAAGEARLDAVTSAPLLHLRASS